MLSIQLDDSQIRKLEAYFKGDFPFQMSVALNRTANDIRDYLRASLPKHFVIRSRFVQSRTQVNYSDKRNLIVEVGHSEDFMRLQAEGGKKSFKSRDVAIPMVGSGLPRTNIRARVTPAKWPNKLTQKKDVFAGRPGPPGTNKYPEGVWRRIRQPGKDDKVKLLYFMRDSVIIKQAWPFDEMVQKIAAGRFKHHVNNLILNENR